MQQLTSTEMRKESDEFLLRRVAQRDTAAYELFYDRHAQAVYNLLVRILFDKSVAEELMQDVFWQVWQKAGQFEGTGAPAAWLLRMARNRAIDQIRRQRARPVTAYADFDSFEQSAEFVVHDVEHRVCLELAYFEGMSQREISDKTSTPLGTIKTRMNMGMQKLERMLRAIGYP